MNSVTLWLIFFSVFAFTGASATSTVIIKIETDDFPSDISWQLWDSNDFLLAENDGTTYLPLSTYEDTVFVESSACFRFVIRDSNNDGIASPGSFAVAFDGSELVENTPFSSEIEFYFNCASGFSCINPIPIPDTSFILLEGPAEANFWYVFSPATTGTYQINTCPNFLPDFSGVLDTKLWIYDNCQSIHSPGPDGALAFSDDFSACSPGAGINYFEMLGGQTYYIRLGLVEEDWDSAVRLRFTRFESLPGCSDPAACNFDSRATSEDGSCFYDDCAPDLLVDEQVLNASLEVDTVFNTDACLAEEGCLRGLGERIVLRFTTHIENVGDADFIIGYPEENPGSFSNDNCHEHWHHLGYARYQLYRGAGMPEPVGFKNGFCVEDIGCSTGSNPKFSCNYMGLTAGCYDVYPAGLDCQWIDITDTPDGIYTLVVSVNWLQLADLRGFAESDFSNNWAQACIELDRSSGNLVVNLLGNCPNYVDCEGVENGEAEIDCTGTCGGNTHHGDLNQDYMQDSLDLLLYLDACLTGNLPVSNCTDLNANGQISLYDAVLLADCIQENFDNIANPFHEHCTFPAGILSEDTVHLSLANEFDPVDNYLDIYYYSPVVDLRGFQFTVTGINITQIELLGPTVPKDYIAHAGGQVLVKLSAQSSLPRNLGQEAFLRLYFDEFTAGEICLNELTDIIDINSNKLNTEIAGDCRPLLPSSNSALEPIRFEVFPNPVTEQLNVQFDHIASGHYELYAMSGQKIQEAKFEAASSLALLMKHLPSGIYNFRIITSNQIFTIKVVKIASTF